MNAFWNFDILLDRKVYPKLQKGSVRKKEIKMKKHFSSPKIVSILGTTYITSEILLELCVILLVKTDGKYIYSFSNITHKVRIIKVGKEPELISEIDVKTDKFRPMSDMYLSGDKLVIIGYDYVETYAEQTVAIVYDIKDEKNPEKLYELRQSGYYYSSRLIGDKLYLISNYSVFYENIDKKEDTNTVIENQVINIIINFTLDGMEYKVEK